MSTTNFPGGVSTVSPNAPLGEFILPDITRAHTFFDDFDNINVSVDWTLIGTGGGTIALADGDGGRVFFTNDTNENDRRFLHLREESFLITPGKKVWFDCLFQANEATQSDIILGLQITNTDPLAVTDGIYFFSADGFDTIGFAVEKDSVSTLEDNVATLVADIDTRISFFYNGIDKIKLYVDGVQRGSSVTTNLPDDQTLTVMMGIQNGAASATIMQVDYIMVAKER